MSDKLPMVAVEKVILGLKIKATTKVKLDKMQKAAGLSHMNTLCNVLLDDATSKVALTEDDIKKVNEIIQSNIETRKKQKKQKGIK